MNVQPPMASRVGHNIIRYNRSTWLSIYRLYYIAEEYVSSKLFVCCLTAHHQLALIDAAAEIGPNEP